MNELDRSETMNELDRLETDLTLAMAQIVAMTEAMIEAEANIDDWAEAIEELAWIRAKTIKADITRIEARIAATTDAKAAATVMNKAVAEIAALKEKDHDG